MDNDYRRRLIEARRRAQEAGDYEGAFRLGRLLCQDLSSPPPRPDWLRIAATAGCSLGEWED